MSDSARSHTFASLRRLVFVVALAAMAWFGLMQVALADGSIIVNTIGPGDVDDAFCSLTEAIISANTDSSYHGCTISGTPGADTIYLQAGATYTLTAAHSDVHGYNGLPDITSTITIEGQGATITRDPISPDAFRFFHVSWPGDLTLRDVTVTGGFINGSGSWWTEAGGGIFISSGGKATVIDSTFVDNVASGSGGGIYVWAADLTASNLIVQDNWALSYNGGGIAGSGSLTMTGGSVTGNKAVFNGGGIWLFGRAALDGTTVMSNTADQHGGGLYLQSNGILSTLEDVTISRNTSQVNGGGLAMATDVLLRRATLSGNRSYNNGGAIFATTYISGRRLSLVNTTVYSNAALVSGGGLYANYPGSGLAPAVSITHTTFASNTAASAAGGSIYNNQSIISVASTILAHGAAGSGNENCDGNPTANITSHGYNIESGQDCALGGTGDQQGIDPDLGPLQDNGGETLTMAPNAGSLAYDQAPAGASDCRTRVTTDQRSRARIPPCDVGSYEYSLPFYLPLVLRQS